MDRLDKYLGSLAAGAAGDALGYTVEFLSYEAIKRKYGSNGICDYDRKHGMALISDDTQMLLFTAQALLISETRKLDIIDCLFVSYYSWFLVQSNDSNTNRKQKSGFGFLFRDERMWERRAPGMTCMRSLRSGIVGTIENKINDSAGCGGVMRVAPIGLYYSLDCDMTEKEVAYLGAESAAITHGNPRGYIPSALLTDILYNIMNETDKTLHEIIVRSNNNVREFFENSCEAMIVYSLIDKAISLATRGGDAVMDINELGEGWVGDEALAIAAYCSLRYTDPEEAIIAAVNHNGDSDSTGSICGNIVGAWHGYSKLPSKLFADLELMDIIDEFARAMDARNYDCDAMQEKYKV